MMTAENLPNGWTITRLGDIASYIQRGKSPKYTDRSELPVINQKSIRWHGVEKEHLKYIHPDQWSNWSEERFVRDFDILWNSTGTGTIGRACLFRASEFDKIVVDSHVTIVRSIRQAADPAYIFYFIMSPMVQKKIEDMQTGSTNQVELGRKAIAEMEVPLAPLNEQQRIVSKIEELFSDLDEGEAALQRVQRLLVSYRQAVLKAAVTGELTKEWREANQHRLESGQELLQRILKIRRAQWKGRGQYQEPQPPETDSLLDLPEGWIWATVEMLASTEPYAIVDGPFGSNLKTSHYRDQGVRVIRLENIGDGVFIDHETFISETHAETLHRHSIHSGDLVIASLGIPLPKACQIPAHIERAIVKADCIKYRPNGNFVESRFILSWLVSPILRDKVANAVRGVGRPRMNLRNIKVFPVPLPNLIEQQAIVERLEDIFSRIDTLASWCATELARSATLRQSILKAAFSGTLVPQDPIDEPASALLERIQIAHQSPSLSRLTGHTSTKTTQPTLWEPT